MSSAEFRVFPWQKPFLPELKKFVDEVSDGCPGNVLIITPNRRPARYMIDLYRKDRTTTLLPKMITITDMVSIWRSALATMPLRMANRLDQVGLLHECVSEIAAEDEFLARNFRHLANMADFLPWGLRLSGILEDFAIEGRELANMENLDSEVGRPAAALLGCLRKIGDSWRARLEQRNWTTPGLDHYIAASEADSIPRLLMPAVDRPVIVAGFYMLTGTHEKLLKSLWEKGAYVCLHTYVGITNNRQTHPACARHEAWLEKWHARAVSVMPDCDEGEKTSYSFFAGHDLHTQLGEMAEILAEPGKDKMSTAVILGKNETLMAALQNMPDKSVNVSMGYPMDRSPLVRLIDDILTMAENSPRPNVWQVADVLKVIRHPYLNMLKFPNESGQMAYLAKSISIMDAEIRKHGMYWDSCEYREAGNQAVEKFVWLASLFADIKTPAGLADALEAFCIWLAEHGKSTWGIRFPLDVEVMHRLTHEIIPALRNNMLAQCEFAIPALRQMLEQLEKSERIPFEADPMHGLQILGMLESRLLQFDRVLILDATDDILPGNPAQDPLLPESLRALLGLPESRTREQAAFYNLSRLCACAKEVHFLWQEGVGKSDFYDSKKIRSRFVEKLIWEKEQTDHELLKQGKSPVRHPRAKLKISHLAPRPLSRKPELDSAIKNFWTKPVPVTSLDVYLRCPAQFLWQYILGLQNSPKSEKNKYRLLGELVHEILQDIYTPFCKGSDADNIVDKSTIGDSFEQMIRDSFNRIARDKNLRNRLPLDSYLTLETTIPARFLEFWNNQPEKTSVLALEVDLNNKIDIKGRPVAFSGRADRLDCRDGGLYILDYKTTRDIPANDPDIWENTDFFSKVGDACQTGDQDALVETFKILSESTQSLQLGVYLLLLQKSKWVKDFGNAGNAAWVPLRHKGVEQTLFATPLVGEDDMKLEHCRQCIELVNSHMMLTDDFTPTEDEKCASCTYKNLCWQ